MDLSTYTFWELNVLYFQLGIEYLKRIWWILLIIFVIMFIITFKEIKK